MKARARRMPTVHAVTLGCPKNRVDTEVLLGDLLSHGYALAAEAADADVVVVNTCGFLAAARRESLEVLRELAAGMRPGARLVAAGCMVERFRDEVASAVPEAQVLIGTRQLLSLRGVLDGERPGPGPESGPRLLTTAPPAAYLKVAEGCSRRCAFCIIPAIRGRQRSRGADDVVAEARSLVASGANELVLVAQDLTHWGTDLPGRPRLATLVRRLATEVPARWIRLMYLYPRDIDDDLLDAIASRPNVLRYLDMPVQHADDRVLAAMRRGTTRRQLSALVARVRARLPGAVLRTTYLVGFPGETDEAFRTLQDFATFARFEMAGVFAFSPEPGAAAARQTCQVAPRVARERVRLLEDTLSRVAAESRAGMTGEVHEAVIESFARGRASGRLWFQAPEVDGRVRIAVPAGVRVAPGAFVRVRVTGACGIDFDADLFESCA